MDFSFLLFEILIGSSFFDRLTNGFLGVKKKKKKKILTFNIIHTY